MRYVPAFTGLPAKLIFLSSSIRAKPPVFSVRLQCSVSFFAEDHSSFFVGLAIHYFDIESLVAVGFCFYGALFGYDQDSIKHESDDDDEKRPDAD